MKLDAFRNFTKLVHLATRAKQVSGNSSPDFLSGFYSPRAIRTQFTILLQPLLNRRWTDVVGSGINVGENWSRADARDASGSRKKSVGRRHNGIAAADAQRHHDCRRRIWFGGNTYDVTPIAIAADAAMICL